jgi:2-oxo-3-hexenedioate decarboxylase
LAETNDKLGAGDIVMTGNWVTTKFPDVSSTYRFDVQGLGAVELSVRN